MGGERLARVGVPFVHAAAVLSLAFTLYELAAHGWLAWVFASTAAGLALTYVAFRALGGPRHGAVLALSWLGFAAAAAAFDSHFGVWRAAALSPLVAFYTLVDLRPGSLSPRGPPVAAV